MNHQVDKENTLFAELAPEEGVLLNLKTKFYFRLNETSQVIWKSLCDGKSMDAIANEMKETFDVDEAELLEDIRTLTKKLQDEGFLLTNDPKPQFSVSAAQTSKKQG